MSVSPDAAEAARDDHLDLAALVTESARKAFGRLPHRGRVAIDVYVNAALTIPGTGVGGFTDQKGTVFIGIDPAPGGSLKSALETWLPATVAHELHHSSRIRIGPGYGGTLGGALVSEGLADHFAQEVFPDTPPLPFDHALSAREEARAWQMAQPILGAPHGYDHRAWFFGAGNLPRWTGYTLGYDITGAYLGDDRSASDAVKTPAATVIETYASTH